MYSGTTIRDKSGHALGVHQRIDRLARRSLTTRGVKHRFPTISDILHFEGNNGPDGLKRKSPGVDEPWHEIDPTDSSDTALVRMIRDHRHNLTYALKYDNVERAAFEAAWLAHAIVDGLTPAHHYPLSAKIEELWGKPHDTRESIRDKVMIKGSSRRDTFARNWEYWGAKGVFSTHVLFEWGVGMAISTHRFSTVPLTDEIIANAQQKGFETIFLEAVHEIYELNMYEEFWRNGWTTHLARLSRKVLIPLIAEIVAVAWYEAYREAGL